MTSATPNGPIPFWRTDIGELDNHRSTPTLPEDSDVVVIGAGFAAAAFVTHLQSLSTSHHSITVLEARQLCSGATGRNGGHLKPDAYQYIASIAAAHGLEAAAELADFEVANLSAVGDYIQREKVDCDFKLTRAVDVQLDLGVHTRIKAGYDALRLAGVEAAKNVEYYEGQAAREVGDQSSPSR
jgi:glycine/D-amino acid oxidase-like deaminating enzyme